MTISGPQAPGVGQKEAPLRRLVILPVCSRDLELARIVLQAVERGSTLPGEIWLAWNDTAPCPEDLAGPGRIIQVYPEPLGWCGISRAIGDGLRYALREGYDAAIKIDSDTAIIARGWDAALCAKLEDRPRLTGWICPMLIDHRLIMQAAPWAGEAVRVLSKNVARNEVVAAWGACYALSRAALQKIDAKRGLATQGREEMLYEDVLLSVKAWESGVDVWDADGVVHGPPNAGMAGCYVVHPVKDPAAMRWFTRDVLSLWATRVAALSSRLSALEESLPAFQTAQREDA
ncbi:MAG TPA: hypothetical protein PK280_14035 [Planctomycetota bacterium]|nr:hypothetical protein [Planctomycetota bacterium]